MLLLLLLLLLGVLVHGCESEIQIVPSLVIGYIPGKAQYCDELRRNPIFHHSLTPHGIPIAETFDPTGQKVHRSRTANGDEWLRGELGGGKNGREGGSVSEHRE